MNRKAAPRRQVVQIERVGSWGRVEYLHHLECGHISSRKRAATTDVLACDGCVLAQQHEENLRKQDDHGAVNDEIWDALGSQIAISEREAALIKAALVAQFGVPAEAVDVVLGDDDGVMRLQYAVILLSADEVRALLAQKTT